MDGWQDVTLDGKPEFKGVRPDAIELNVYKWELSRTPEEDWVHLLENEMSLSSFHPIQLSGDLVWLTPPEGQLQAYADNLRTKIAATNTQYRSALPELGDQGVEAAREAVEEQARADRAAKEIANLSLGDGADA